MTAGAVDDRKALANGRAALANIRTVEWQARVYDEAAATPRRIAAPSRRAPRTTMSTATKAHPRLVPANAVFDGAVQPTEEGFREGLGPAYGPLHQVLEWCEREYPAYTSEWRYAPLSGWYRIYVFKKRRMFYLLPRRRGFRLVILLGDRALAALREGPLGGGVDSLLGSAKRYPEGTAFTLESEGFYPEVAIALLSAKLSA